MLRKKKRRTRVHLVVAWGAFCYLKQNRHSDPFNKIKTKGKLRRDERRFKLRQREECLQ